MWSKVQQVVDGYTEMLKAAGIEFEVIDVIDCTVTIALRGEKQPSEQGLAAVRQLLDNELKSERPDITEVIFELEFATLEEDIRIQIDEPNDDENTCKIIVNRDIAPEGSVYFDVTTVTPDQPLFKKLLAIDNVYSILAKNELLIVSRSEAPWPPILEAVQAVLSTHFGAEKTSFSTPRSNEEVRAHIQQILDDEINPGVAMHGGLIDLLDVNGATAYVHMGGGCQGCSAAAATLRQGIESSILKQVPEVTRIMDSTDHAAGENPYYRA
jgi:Fe-S cluster biogenesis protein NfuA